MTTDRTQQLPRRVSFGSTIYVEIKIKKKKKIVKLLYYLTVENSLYLDFFTSVMISYYFFKKGTPRIFKRFSLL